MSFDATDGYRLFDQIRYGDRHTLIYESDSYTFQFVGESVGHSSSLIVEKSSGERREYAPGFDLECCFNALEEIELGWAVPQTHLPRFYQDHD